MDYYISSSETEEDLYNPLEERHYKYNINHLLNDNIDIILENNNFGKIYLCCYEVNNNSDALHPFLQYYLFNNILNDNLCFPELNIVNDNLDTDNLVEIAKNLLFILFGNNHNLNENSEYNGAMFYKNDFYLFFDLSKCKIQIDFLYKRSKVWLCLLDEIVNKMSICNINISSMVTDFFVNNSDLVFLYDNDDFMYETPSVCYIGKNWNKLNFTHTFGVDKLDKMAILGPYYYFTNFENAVEQCDYSEHQDKMGVIRFAIFTGVMKIINNLQNNTHDESVTKNEMLNDPAFDNKYVALTSRISDHDGRWSEKYDSAFIGSYIELDDGTKLKENCLTIVKKYEQQLPLTCQYINKKSVLDSCKNGIKKYTIM